MEQVKQGRCRAEEGIWKRRQTDVDDNQLAVDLEVQSHIVFLWSSITFASAPQAWDRPHVCVCVYIYVLLLLVYYQSLLLMAQIASMKSSRTWWLYQFDRLESKYMVFWKENKKNLHTIPIPSER